MFNYGVKMARKKLLNGHREFETMETTNLRLVLITPKHVRITKK